jgi:hypothetical protein
MAVLEWQDKVKEVAIGAVRLDAAVAQCLVDEAESGADPTHAKTVRSIYSYKVPFPGVRYYSFEELLL